MVNVTIYSIHGSYGGLQLKSSIWVLSTTEPCSPHCDRTLESWTKKGESSQNGLISGQWNILIYPEPCLNRAWRFDYQEFTVSRWCWMCVTQLNPSTSGIRAHIPYIYIIILCISMIYIYMYTCIYISIYTHIYIWIHIYIHIYIYIYIYIYIFT